MRASCSALAEASPPTDRAGKDDVLVRCAKSFAAGKRGSSEFGAALTQIVLRAIDIGQRDPTRGKRLAASGQKIRNGIRPAANRRDFAEVPEHITRGLNIHFVDHFEEVVGLVF